MPRNSPLKNRVKELRERLNIRQSELAREVNITRQTIIAIEKGRLNPSIVICLKIAKLLREPVDYIFYLEPGYDYEQEALENATRPKRGRKKRVPVVAPVEEAPEPAISEVELDTIAPFDPAVPANSLDTDVRIDIERDAAAAELEPIEEPADLADAEETDSGDGDFSDVPLAPEPVEVSGEVQAGHSPAPLDSAEHHGEEAKSGGQAIWDFF